MSTELLKTRGQPLPPELAAEWDDKRDAAWVPLRSMADWRCPQGHRYQASIAARKASLARGADHCTHPKHVSGLKAAPAALKGPAHQTITRRSGIFTPAEEGELAQLAGETTAFGTKSVNALGANFTAAPGSPSAAPASAPATPAPPAPQSPANGRAGANPGKSGGMGHGGYDAVQQAENAAYDRSEFLVRDLLGRPSAVYAWERARVGQHCGTPPAVAHHVLVLDRSGSMCGDIAGMRDLVRRLLAVEEYRRPGLLVSVVSYSSQGALRKHVERVRITDLNDRVSLDELWADGLTCMSDGLEAALRLVRAAERTTVTVHSDGYVNDPDPASERRRVSDLCAQLHALNAVVNTVAYRLSSDFALLSAVANAGGGACVQATTLQAVYDALVTAQRGAVGPAGATLTVPPGADYAVRVHRGLRRILCAAMAGRVSRDIDDVGADEEVYFVTHTTKHLRDGDGMVCTPMTDASIPVMLGLARGLVGAGRHALAKQVALSTGISRLRQHARALTGPQVAALAADLDDLLMTMSGGDPFDMSVTGVARQPFLPQPEPKVTLPELLAVLGRKPGAVRVFLPALLGSYRRRGLKRVPGKQEGGKVVEPLVCAVKRRAGTGSDGWVDLVSVDQNDAEATVNLTVAEPVDLVRRSTEVASSGGAVRASASSQQRVAEVAGVSLENLRQYKSFTVVGDGEVCLRSLPCRVTDKALHAELRALGALPDTVGGFSPDTRVDLSLDLPLLRSAGAPACPSESVVLRVLRLSAMQRLLAASLKGGSASPYSAEQVAALKAVHVTPSLCFSPPTCYPYADLKAAQSEGKVDSRTRYRVTFGAAGLLSSDDLPSANEFLQRRWVCARISGKPLDKPSMVDFFDAACGVREKVATETKRLKIGAVDGLVMPLYVLAFQRRHGQPWPRHAIGHGGAAQSTAFGSAELGLPETFGAGRSWTDPQARRADLRPVEEALEAARAEVRAAVMAVGASGQVPDEWGPALSVEEVGALGYRVGKAERDGSFRHCGGVLVSVYAREALFSVSYEGSGPDA